MSVKKFFYFVYIFLVAVFLVVVGIFYYFEQTQKKTIYNFIFHKEITQNKQSIKLETYAACEFINIETRTEIKKTVNRLKEILNKAEPNISHLCFDNITELKTFVKRFNESHIFKLAIFSSKLSIPSYINQKSCKPYTYFNLKNTYICKTNIVDKKGIPQSFLLYARKKDNLTIGTFTNMNRIEIRIAKEVEPKLNRLLFKYKTPDSYFFIAKILNINGGKKSGYNIYNPSKGIEIGKPEPSDVVDAKGNHYREKYLKALKKYGETYSVYWYPSPTSIEPHEKISFRKLYKPLNWMVGTGFYVETVKREAASISNRLFNRLKYFHILLFLVFLLIILTIHLINTHFNRLVNRDTELIITSIPKLGKESEPIDTSKLNFFRFRLIGNALNRFSKELKEKTEQIETNRIEFIKAFVKVLEVRDVYTRGHSERVAFYSQKIAELLGLNEKRQHNLFVAGLLHDLGKVAIPDSILLKPGKLSENEYNIMKLHPVFSYEIIKDIGFFKELATFVKQHHERCDGSGYPDGIPCEKITVEGRILAIADVLDALTTSRPYRKAFEIDEAIEIMKKMALDQKIIRRIEDEFGNMLIKERNNVEIIEILNPVEKSRIELFEKDQLTGLFRIKTLIKEIQEKLTKSENFYLFMVDIKHLKKVNYRLGYEKGNDLLMEVSKAIKSLDGTELHSRIGASFFAFVYTGKNPVELKRELEKLLESISINNFKPEFYIGFISSSGIKNAEEMIYLLEMQIESMKIAAMKNQ